QQQRVARRPVPTRPRAWRRTWPVVSRGRPPSVHLRASVECVLHMEVDGRGPRLVLVHGFTQNRNCWGPIGTDLARDHEVVRLDAPGHGESSAVHAALHTGAGLMADRGGHATYLGYSMGARFVLHLALEQPDLVAGLVLVGGTAGIEDASARAERKRADAANA